MYTEGAVGSTGTWAPTPGVPHLQGLDATAGANAGMHFYASKSFFDPAGAPGGRRVYWGWALVPPASTQTLPRVTTFHPKLMSLTFNPAPELAALRALPPLASIASITVADGASVWLGNWAPGAGNQSEFGVTFSLPTQSATFGMTVGNGGDGSNNVSTPIIIEFNAASLNATVTVGGTVHPQNLTYYMPGVDLPGADYNVTDVDYSDPHICQAACTADGEKCQAYTYVVRPPKVGSCCLKNSVPNADSQPTCTSGSKVSRPLPGQGGATAALPLLPGDSAIDVRVFVDNTFVEVFVMHGRLAFTYNLNPGPQLAGAAGATLFASGAAVQATDVNAWHMNPIWVSTGEVLASRR